MNTEQFSKIVEEGLERTRRVLIQKAEVYARGDRLSNFKAASNTWGHTPEHCLYGMVLKHWVKLTDMIADIEENNTLPTTEQLEETTGDIRAYMHLAEALIKERIQQGQKKDYILYRHICGCEDYNFEYCLIHGPQTGKEEGE